MKKSKDLIDEKIEVVFFQRRPRPGYSFSLEYIFDDIRSRLKNKIVAEIKISKLLNDGYFSKLINIVEATFRQGKTVNHIAGEMHFLNLFMKKKTVLLTILDCGVMPWKKGLEKYLVKLLYLTWPIKRSNYVVAISEMTKQEVIAYTKCPADKIVVIPVAVDAMYQPCPKPFNSTKPSILHIGTGHNKNLLRLIEALDGLNCHLTIIGKLNNEYLEALKKHNIEYTSEYGITQDQMYEKYKECDILAFVSVFEGFGMPIIEANSVERAVLTSKLYSMPEVAGNAACLINPFDIKDIRQGMEKLIADEKYRNELIENGRSNKLRFDAKRIADAYYDIYRKIASNN